MDVAENAGYKGILVKNTYKKCLNHFNNIQKEKRKFATFITFNNYTSLKLKSEAAKLGIYITIKPNLNILSKNQR